ncbi:hypothetical protein HMPREF6485_1725 [Segatella buccae ATCC 33574]|uniref:Uncharacterized protein n=1 Tax=Segatella buccae ATCC 33574 TaxID=873513 RepID=E6K778_9BACT|nr:hypothetical protein HMPREF6485_1725 [Segatella buccae ATCC 33574]
MHRKIITKIRELKNIVSCFNMILFFNSLTFCFLSYQMLISK